jgi:hypothetical protein
MLNPRENSSQAQIQIRTVGRVAVGELLVEHAAEHLGDAAVPGGVLRPVGHQGPVELLPRLLVGPGRRRREDQGEREGDDGRSEPPARRGGRGGERHRNRAREADSGRCGTARRRGGGRRRDWEGGRFAGGASGSVILFCRGRGEIGWRGGVVVPRSRRRAGDRRGVASRRDGPVVMLAWHLRLWLNGPQGHKSVLLFSTRKNLHDETETFTTSFCHPARHGSGTRTDVSMPCYEFSTRLKMSDMTRSKAAYANL